MGIKTSAKPSNQERIKEIVAGIEDGIRNLFQSEKFMEYLRTMSRFHNYSLNNTLLIHMQKPNASLCAGFRQWKEKFGRHVKKGETGITIIAPTPFKKKIEEEKLDPDTKLPMRDENGKIIMEERTIEIPLFKPVKVFDVSQTEGKPLPQLAAKLSGDVRQYEAFMEALRRTAPVPVSFKPLPPNLDGYFSPTDQNIAIREGMSQVQTVCATVHEIAHSVLHNMESPVSKNPALFQIAEILHIPAIFSPDRIPKKDVPDSLFRYEVRNGADLTPDAVGVSVRERFGGTVITSKPLSIPENGLLPLTPVDGLLLSSDECTIGFFQKENGKDRNTEEVEAESVSYAVCQYYGIETGTNSFGYIATWSEGRELKELRASLETITKATSHLISDIDKHFKEIYKERGIKLSEQKTEKSAEPEKESAPEKPVETTVPEADAPEVPAADTEKKPEPVPDVEPVTVTAEPPASETAVEAVTPTEQGPVPEPDTADVPENATPEPESVPNMEPAPVTAENPPATETAAPEVPAADTEKEPEKEPESVPDVEPVPEKTEPPSTETAVEAVTPPEQGPVPEPEAADTSKNATPEPEQPDTTLDEYPLPDTTVSPDALAAVGYTAKDLLPLSLDRACELMDRDMSVYMLQTGENPAMAFDSEELREQPEGTLFALPCDEWEASADFQQAVDNRMERQEEREAAFLNHAGDCFAIYQVRPDDELRDLRYEPLDRLQQRGQTPERGNYDLAYTAPLPEGAALDALFARFNTDHPPDYRRPSVSVSDILAIQRDGVVTCSYVDRFGFVQLPGFLEQENPLKNAEMLVEDDRNMIDGIINNGPKEDAPPTVAELEAQARSGQPISLLELAAATRREEAEKQHGQRPRKRESVLAKLRQIPPESGKKRTAPKKSAERGL